MAAPGSAGDPAQFFPESRGFVGGQFDDETTATLDRNADNDPTPLLGCFQGSIPSTWLHRRHFANSLQSSPRRGGFDDSARLPCQ